MIETAAKSGTMVCVRPGSVRFTSLTLLLFLKKEHAGVYQYMAVHLLTCLGFLFLIQKFSDVVYSWSRLAHAGSFVLHYLNFRCAASPCIPVRQGTVILVMGVYNSMYMAWWCKHMLLLYALWHCARSRWVKSC